MTLTELKAETTYFVKEHSTILRNCTKFWAMLLALVRILHLTVCSNHFRYNFQSEPTLYICLNVKELLAGNWRHIWSLSDSNGTRTHNHLLRKRTFSHLVKLRKLLSGVVSTRLYGAFDCMFLSCHQHVSEWIHTLYLPEHQGTPCSKQVLYMRFTWLQRDFNPQALTS